MQWGLWCNDRHKSWSNVNTAGPLGGPLTRDWVGAPNAGRQGLSGTVPWFPWMYVWLDGHAKFCVGVARRSCEVFWCVLNGGLWSHAGRYTYQRYAYLVYKQYRIRVPVSWTSVWYPVYRRYQLRVSVPRTSVWCRMRISVPWMSGGYPIWACLYMYIYLYMQRCRGVAGRYDYNVIFVRPRKPQKLVWYGSGRQV